MNNLGKRVIITLIVITFSSELIINVYFKSSFSFIGRIITIFLIFLYSKSGILSKQNPKSNRLILCWLFLYLVSFLPIVFSTHQNSCFLTVILSLFCIIIEIMLLLQNGAKIELRNINFLKVLIPYIIFPIIFYRIALYDSVPEQQRGFVLIFIAVLIYANVLSSFWDGTEFVKMNAMFMSFFLMLGAAAFAYYVFIEKTVVMYILYGISSNLYSYFLIQTFKKKEKKIISF